jgi:hypothetical protein
MDCPAGFFRLGAGGKAVTSCSREKQSLSRRAGRAFLQDWIPGRRNGGKECWGVGWGGDGDGSRPRTGNRRGGPQEGGGPPTPKKAITFFLRTWARESPMREGEGHLGVCSQQTHGRRPPPRAPAGWTPHLDLAPGLAGGAGQHVGQVDVAHGFYKIRTLTEAPTSRCQPTGSSLLPRRPQPVEPRRTG